MSRWQEKKSKDDFESNISFFKIWIHSRFPHAWPANPCDYLPQTHGIAPVKHIIYMNPHSHPDGFYWGHQCSWTLIPANSMQASNEQSNDCNRKYSGLMQGLNLLRPISLGKTLDFCKRIFKEVISCSRWVFVWAQLISSTDSINCSLINRTA